MIGRLKAYAQYLCEIPTGQEKSTFESGLTEFYTLILAFLAQGLKVYKSHALIRTTTAFWTAEKITTFELECEKLGNRIAEEARNCDRVLSVKDREVARKCKEHLENLLCQFDHLAIIDQSIYDIQSSLELDRLPAIDDAAFDSYAEARNSTCLDDTRVEILQKIEDWSTDANGHCVYWLSGGAGTGKSTISRTIAKRLNEHGRLGATFFFKRGEGARSSAKYLFATFAKQLAQRDPVIGTAVTSKLRRNRDLPSKSLRQQFDELIYSSVFELQQSRPEMPILIAVIDALDECEDESDIRTIIKIFSHYHSHGLHKLRIFVTSRPEIPIREEFSNLETSIYHDIILQKETEMSIKHDIRLFYHTELSAWSWKQTHLSPGWLGEEELHALVQLSVPLFISASTVCRFLKERKKTSPSDRLKALLDSKSRCQVIGLKSTYQPILDQYITDRDDEDREGAKDDFQTIIGTVIAVFEPISIRSVQKLFSEDLSEYSIRHVLDYFHSVLDIPAEVSDPIRPFHLSFHDFLMDPKQQDIWFGVKEAEIHYKLASNCLRLLSRHLHRNPCNLQHFGTRRDTVKQSIINRAIPAEVSYACRYWMVHLEKSKHTIQDDGPEHKFLKTKFAFWVEYLSWLGCVHSCIDMMRTMTISLRESSTQLLNLGVDAQRFLLQNCFILDVAPLQLYTSSLIFAPEHSLIKTSFKSQTPDNLVVNAPCIKTWSQELLKLEGHADFVWSIVFSPVGGKLASASRDKAIRIWDLSTGLELQKLEGHTTWVTSVAFSPDKNVLASASHDKTVRLWDLSERLELQKLEGHTTWVTNVAFSLDGKVLASTSYDKTIRLWDPLTGLELHKLEGHDDKVTGVAFSPDGKMLASASDDKTVRLWNSLTGLGRYRLEGHVDQVTSVAFSPDGKLLASASHDTTVRLWDSSTGLGLQKLEGHANVVTSVAFSLDGKLLASASYDKTIRLWSPLTIGLQLQELKGHTHWVRSISFSPDGTLLASASDDETIRLWDVVNGTELDNQRHTGGSCLVKFTQAPWQVTFDIYSFRVGAWRTSEENLSQHDLLYLEGSWAKCQEENLLWLPHDYRGVSSSSHGVLAVMSNYGIPTFIKRQ
ncbi:hypothetical protein K461DRAFT_229781 [Myriangium duriaei CBS 260.36]|uniref:Nephrocystin 3-like N-terminal domain-containing protein n=1 Tax=Myriangium duriaei CBS 260.36 TaxID=1168546 RepID=A0A9P4ITG8_9PEZI|nr:hypothetical protein K461DRAFT_229781 [Myriangium duriaei CBS 260.36]